MGFLFMNIESLLPFALILAPFILAFFVEALVIYFFKLKKFWGSVGISFAINIISIALVFYVAGPVLGKLGYEVGQFNGLNLPIQALAFVWWFSLIADGLMLQLVIKNVDRKKIYLASILMNTLSYLFLHLFIEYSH